MTYMGAVIAAGKKIADHNKAESETHRAALVAACGDADIGVLLVDVEMLEAHSLDAAIKESNRVFEVEVAIIALAGALGRMVTLAEAQEVNLAFHTAAYPPAPARRGFLSRPTGR